MSRLARHLATGLALVAMFVAGFALCILTEPADTKTVVRYEDRGTDPFSGDRFPCAEDDYLGYHPRFGPDRVGCVHVEEIQEGW